MNAKTQQILSELRKHLEEIYGSRLSRMILFGSQARGDAEEGSDIDVLVVLHGEVNPYEEVKLCLDFNVSINLEYGELIGFMFMGEDEYLKEGGPFLRNVRSEGVAV